MIKYKKGNVLENSDVNRIICHVVNNKGGFGKGFAFELGNKYPLVKRKYKEWYGLSLLYGDAKFKLGSIQTININENLWVINMLCQDGYATRVKPCVLDYIALEICLNQVKEFNKRKGFEIWMPKIGSGYSGGEWSKIESIINKVLQDENITIYEL